MKRRFARFADVAPRIGVALFVAGFIGADLLHASGWDWRGWVADLRARVASTGSPAEIRNYVEFVTVTTDRLTIVTGVEFDSSRSRRITKQWCYVELAKTSAGDPLIRLDLAGIKGAGRMVPALFTDRNLAPLGLTPPQTQDLVARHCRFRT